MANLSSAGRNRCATGSTCQPKAPVCPDCGALECLCRPRFFAGQLLTEQDLNLLDQYIKKKHRLHNRNLHGWGVVNGLLVLCDPCGEVKVTSGYALSPCGDDIVVCEETGVDICDLIRRCRQQDPRPCRPYSRPPNSNCDDLEEDWILAIRYREWQTRGVTPLRGAGCESRPAGTCGCAAESAQTSTKPRGAPIECEPSVVCEGFSFDVYRRPEVTSDPGDDDQPLLDPDSAFMQQFMCCAQPLLDAVPDMPSLNADAAIEQNARALANWCCRFRANLLDYFLRERNVRCEIVEHLRAVVCPSASNLDDFVTIFVRALLDLVAAWAEGIKNCLCLALLPPAPLPTADERVPLASVRIRARDCSILSICNWTTERKLVMTWPTVGYWTGILSLGKTLRGMVETFCCNSLLEIFDDVFDDRQRDPVGGVDAAGGTIGGSTVGIDTSNSALGSQQGFSQYMNQASGVFAGGYTGSARARTLTRLMARIDTRGDRTLQLGAVVNAVTGRFKLPDNDQPLSAVEGNNVALLLAAEVFAKPFLADLGGAGEEDSPGSGAPQGPTAAESATAATPSQGEELAEVRGQMRRIQARLDAQNADLVNLRRRIDGGE